MASYRVNFSIPASRAAASFNWYDANARVNDGRETAAKISNTATETTNSTMLKPQLAANFTRANFARFRKRFPHLFRVTGRHSAGGDGRLCALAPGCGVCATGLGVASTEWRRILLRLSILVHFEPIRERSSRDILGTNPISTSAPTRSWNPAGFKATLYKRFTSAPALRCAIASIEIMGLTPDADGKDDPSITRKLRASQVSPSGLVAELRAELPMRAEPMM